ncbi:MAG: 50S ribosomal protein L37ae [Candidatus Methanoperedens sp.]|nr:50S ribosomal protein L37ae [Candidatus Methanoperedens sp.]MCZ7361503.1 50S ribosomal protein L37ae [Candidatus Methanoperedens sp.]HLB70445.1 50S ribosomal protein L37ae [Candidatus Methanoperedens sp.]
MAEIRAKGRKSRSAGRFGVRYGVKNRKLVADIEEKMHADYACSKCGAIKVKRKGTGIWQCTKCKVAFAGGSYVPQTSAHLTVLRAVQGEKIETGGKVQVK